MSWRPSCSPAWLENGWVDELPGRLLVCHLACSAKWLICLLLSALNVVELCGMPEQSAAGVAGSLSAGEIGPLADVWAHAACEHCCAFHACLDAVAAACCDLRHQLSSFLHSS